VLSSMLVVLDESPDGGAAVDLGIRWARHHRAAVIGLGIVDEPAIRRPEPLPIGGSYFKARRNAVLLDHARRTVEQVLRQFERRCTEAEVPCTLLERTGSPQEQIALEAQRCDVVLISRQTQVHGARGAIGASLLKGLRRTSRPVVVVPPPVVPPPAPGTGPVVILYDGSAPAARTLFAFQAVGLDVRDGVYLISLDADGKAVAGADRAADFLQRHGVTVRRETVPPAAPEFTAEAILHILRRLNAGLLVLGAEAELTLRGFLRGSLSDALLKQSPVPLFWFS
jgi:nucleotide-binding universal stress UspA family protein